MKDRLAPIRAALDARPWLRRPLSLLPPLSLAALYAPTLQWLYETGQTVLLGWGLGLASGLLLPLLYLLKRPLRERPGAAPPAPGPQRGGPSRAWVARGAFVAVFAGVVVFLKRADVSWQHYESAGAFVVGYSACRFLLALFLLTLCCTLGALALRVLCPHLRRADLADGAYFLICFFGGATLYGLAFALLGLAGWLFLPVALALTLPVVLLAPPVAADLAGACARRVRAAFLGLEGLAWWVRCLQAWCLLGVVGLLTLTRGLYPGSDSNDIWAHYLQYYREVLHSGSVGPNEIWYHFYISKGAGLFHLLGLLSDPLAAQLVSWCFVVATGVVVYQLATKLLRDTSWALLAVTLFFTAYRGTFFKSHDVLAGFIAFLVWALVEHADLAPAARRALGLTLGGAAFYLGFYQPLGASVVAAFLGLLACLLGPFSATRRQALISAQTLGLVLLGAASTLAVNCALTGLAEVVPLELFWPLADRARFHQAFGDSGIAYLLHTQGDKLALQTRLDWDWMISAFRYRQLRLLVPPDLLQLAAVVAVASLSFAGARDRLRAHRHAVSVLLAFCAATFLFAHVVRSASLLRLYVFTTFFSALVAALAVRLLVVVLSSRGVRRWVQAVTLSALGIHALGQELWYLTAVKDAPLWTMGAYYLGRASVADALRAADLGFKNSLSLADVEQIRGFVGPEARIANLGYDQAPAYAFPGVGLVSEVDYAFGPDHLDVVFGSPERAREVLRGLRLDYFLLHLRSPLFSSLACSRLFAPGNLERFFTLYARKGDVYVLTWRGSPEDPAVPARLAQVLELKQKALLQVPQADEFRARVRAASAATLAAWRPGRTGLGEFAAATGRLLEEEMAARAAVPASQGFFERLVASTTRTLDQAMPQLGLVAFSRFGASEGVELPDRFHQQLGDLAVDFVVSEVAHRCAEEFGPELAEALTGHDERQPFGVIYRSRDDFEALLQMHPRPGAAP